MKHFTQIVILAFLAIAALSGCGHDPRTDPPGPDSWNPGRHLACLEGYTQYEYGFGACGCKDANGDTPEGIQGQCILVSDAQTYATQAEYDALAPAPGSTNSGGGIPF